MIRHGDNHYDIISAFIKSMRGSDPDAAVYYLAKMLYAGEDMKFIARRMMILCFGGYWKCRSPGTCSCHSSSPGGRACRNAGIPDDPFTGSRSIWHVRRRAMRAANAIFAAMDSVKLRPGRTVPAASPGCPLWRFDEKLGHGIGYKYAHDYPNHYVKQQYLPDEIQGETFYELSDMGYEKKLKEHMEFIRSHVEDGE